MVADIHYCDCAPTPWFARCTIPAPVEIMRMNKLLRRVLLVFGPIMAVSALVFWIWLNGMASAFGNTTMRMDWSSQEALLLFWLPFVGGLAMTVLAWRKGR
jgi:hypothetical protein